MPSKRLISALALVAILPAITVVSRPTAHAASATLAPPVQTEISGLCYHTDPSDYHCPGSDTSSAVISVPNATTAKLSADANYVQRVSITVVDRSGKSYTNELPATTDAIFLSVKSVRTFLLRHYQATNAKKATALSVYLSKHATSKAAAKNSDK